MNPILEISHFVVSMTKNLINKFPYLHRITVLSPAQELAQKSAQMPPALT
jgi:hypothetical protein